ncbi:hypothetical protein Taro_039401 [Colocasia esculenta]|uniref:DYW domain-containing protein n=1 Tax=Colocasia esculenta TaxID=4460 RepID=A0A843WRF9_COLES|nr:hypothetical protein [Colocasia esculenta]
MFGAAVTSTLRPVLTLSLPQHHSISSPAQTPKTAATAPQPWLPSPELLAQYPVLRHLHSCESMRQLRQIHANAVTTGIARDNFVAARILAFAALSPVGSLPYASLLFCRSHRPDAFMANTLLRAYALSPEPAEALIFYVGLLDGDFVYGFPDVHTFPLLLRACSEVGSLSLGEGLHSQAVKMGCAGHIPIQNFLVHMYASCGSLESARRVFDAMSEFDDASVNIMMGGYMKGGRFDGARSLFDAMAQRDAVSWSVLINGYVKNSFFKQGLELFRDMLLEKVEPNESVLVNVLSACAHLGAVEQGKWVEGYVMKNNNKKKKNIKLTVRVGTALIDTYLKCGFAEDAFRVFDRMEEKNAMTWTAMIGGLAVNGRGRDALKLFAQMEMQKVRPNEVTFIGVLNACSHAGLVEDGLSYFHSMTEVYELKPNVHHYCCLVDLYGRTGLLDKAEAVIKSMPMEPNSAVLGSLLNSCRIHGNLKLGEQVGKQLLQMEPNHSGRYVLLSNLYAANRRWQDVADLRRLMKERGVTKTPGSSFIDLKGAIHEFIAGDRFHPQSEKIYAMLDEMTRKLRMAGHQPNKGQVLIDMDEEEKETALFHHSEKLAIAFGLINSDPGVTIRITKNLRVCADCHSATKLISRIYNREIVVRDRSRFHHFCNGSCSCDDFW